MCGYVLGWYMALPRIRPMKRYQFKLCAGREMCRKRHPPEPSQAFKIHDSPESLLGPPGHHIVHDEVAKDGYADSKWNGEWDDPAAW